MLEIRLMRLEDATGAEAVLVAAFEGLNPIGVVERHVALAPETCLVALDDELVVGLVCAVQYDRAAYIGPMGVSPGAQGKGIGRAMLVRLIAALEGRGCLTMILDATPAGEPLYRKLGFATSSETWDLARERGTGIARLPGLDGLDQAVVLDREVFGADRSAMFRRLIEKEGAALYSSDSGFLISQTRVLGPFAAKDAGVAGALLDRALAEGAVAGRALAPLENPNAERMYVDRGFAVTRRVKQMRRGPALAGMRREWMYGLASFALG